MINVNGEPALPLLHCLVCGRQQPDVPCEGLRFVAHGNYGSTLFDPMTTSRWLEVFICDDCVRQAATQQRVLVGHQPAARYPDPQYAVYDPASGF